MFPIITGKPGGGGGGGDAAVTGKPGGGGGGVITAKPGGGGGGGIVTPGIGDTSEVGGGIGIAGLPAGRGGIPGGIGGNEGIGRAAGRGGGTTGLGLIGSGGAVLVINTLPMLLRTTELPCCSPGFGGGGPSGIGISSSLSSDSSSAGGGPSGMTISSSSSKRLDETYSREPSVSVLTGLLLRFAVYLVRQKSCMQRVSKQCGGYT